METWSRQAGSKKLNHCFFVESNLNRNLQSQYIMHFLLFPHLTTFSVNGFHAKSTKQTWPFTFLNNFSAFQHFINQYFREIHLFLQHVSLAQRACLCVFSAVTKQFSKMTVNSVCFVTMLCFYCSIVWQQKNIMKSVYKNNQNTPQTSF